MSSKTKADPSYPWIMVRLERTTHKRLREYGARAYEAGSIEVSDRGRFGQRDEPSLNAVIEHLLDHLDSHRRRSAASRRRRRAADEGDLD